jgi:hypothetical protein
MAGFWDTAKGVIGGGIFSNGARKAARNFLTGEPGQVHQVSDLTPGQEPLHEQLINSGMNPGAGGAFGTAADYYRDLMSDNPADLAAYTAPDLRQYNEEIVPGLSEQFAGMGSGGLSSSGFRNAQIQGATDLSERIGAIRANLRQAGAQGLTNIGQLGLQPVQSNYQTPGTPGFFQQVAPAIAQAATTYATGGSNLIPKSIGNGINANTTSPGISNGTNATAAIGNPVYPSNTGSKWYGGNAVGKNTSPYGGNNAKASPNIAQRNNFNMPNFMNGQGGY